MIVQVAEVIDACNASINYLIFLQLARTAAAETWLEESKLHDVLHRVQDKLVAMARRVTYEDGSCDVTALGSSPCMLFRYDLIDDGAYVLCTQTINCALHSSI